MESAPLWLAGLKFGSGRRRAGEDTRPYEEGGSFRNIGRGRSQTGPRAHNVRPYGGKRTGSVGSAWPGAAVERHQGQILQTQGPVARRELRVPLRFCAPELFCPLQGVTPVKWGPGKGDYEHEVLIGAVPGGVLPTLPPWAK